LTRRIIAIYNVFNVKKELDMAVNLKKTGQKLMQALNSRGYNLTFSTKQFMGREGRPINMYCINKAIFDDSKNKFINKELYSTTSMVRIVLYLRDMWFLENGWELPTDQELWNKIREDLTQDE